MRRDFRIIAESDEFIDRESRSIKYRVIEMDSTFFVQRFVNGRKDSGYKPTTDTLDERTARAIYNLAVDVEAASAIDRYPNTLDD